MAVSKNKERGWSDRRDARRDGALRVQFGVWRHRIWSEIAHRHLFAATLLSLLTGAGIGFLIPVGDSSISAALPDPAYFAEPAALSVEVEPSGGDVGTLAAVDPTVQCSKALEFAGLAPSASPPELGRPDEHLQWAALDPLDSIPSIPQSTLPEQGVTEPRSPGPAMLENSVPGQLTVPIRQEALTAHEPLPAAIGRVSPQDRRPLQLWTASEADVSAELHLDAPALSTEALDFERTREAAPVVEPDEVALAAVTAMPSSDIETGVPLWRRNAVASQRHPGRPMIAIVLDDLGLNRPNTALATELPAPLTLAFMTYAPNAQGIVDRARARGHEILVHMPMEPNDSGINAGENVLSTANDADEIRRRMDWGLERFQGYVGINNHMGSKFTSTPEKAAAMMAEVKRRGLLFLDSRTSSSSVAADLARHMDVPYAVRDVFLDHVISGASVSSQLRAVEAIALRRGYAVAIGHPHRVTLEALQAWMPEAMARGFVFVPISAIVERQHRLAHRNGQAG